MEAVFPVPGSKVRMVAALAEKVAPSTLVSTETVSVRGVQSAGTVRTTLATGLAAVRSIVALCGHALFALSQYVSGLPSVSIAAARVALVWLVALVGQCRAMLDGVAAVAVPPAWYASISLSWADPLPLFWVTVTRR